MSEGFKKHFNATTMNGRANVAKATYATMALLYIVYRLRKRSGKKSANGGGGGGMLADGSCSCDQEREPTDSDTGFYETDPECGSCRERAERAMSEYDREQQRRSAAKARQEQNDECRSEPPPPPPPPSSSSPPGSGGGGAGAGAGAEAPRRKCPCENPHKKVDGPLKTSSNDTRAFMQRQQQEQQRQQQQQRAYKYQSAQDADDVHPVSEIVGQVHGAVYRVLSGVFNAVMGGGSDESTATNTANATPHSDAQRNENERQASGACNCLNTTAHPEGEEEPVAAAAAARYEAMDCECGQRTGPSGCSDSTPELDDEQAYSEGFPPGMFFGQEYD